MQKVQRHVRWAREGGIKSLIEEDDLDPRHRARNEVRKWRYRRVHPAPSSPRAMWVLGAQRSGTNMVMRALAKHGGIRIYNENHRKAFHDFELLAPAKLKPLVDNCPQPVAVFKPLCDSDRAVELLDLGGQTSRAVWMYRNVDARARSAVTKFGSANIDMIRSLASGQDQGEWWSRSVSPEQRAIVQGLRPAELSPHDGAALFWWMRNSMYFDQQLHLRDDIRLMSYQALLVSPADVMSNLCNDVGLEFDAVMVDHFEPLRSPPRHLDLDPEVRSLCDQLTSQLASAMME